MKAWRQGSEYQVLVDRDEVAEFAGSWPCSGLNADREYVFSFSAATGDLTDLAGIRGGSRVETHEEDGPALAALSEDAGRFGATELGLEDVIAVRWPAPAP